MATPEQEIPTLGTLDWSDLSARPDLIAASVAAAPPPGPTWVAPIDAEMADTTAFCARYQVPAEQSVNCVIVEGRRGDLRLHAAVVVRSDARADINKTVRKQLAVRKTSFAPMDTATSLTGMEYGGITPLGLPADWPILIDQAVIEAGPVVIGAGIRAAKIMIDGADLAKLPGAQVLALALTATD